MSLAPAILSELTIKHGDDRFRHCSAEWMKRVEDAELSRKRPLQTIGANTKRADFALAA